MKGITLVEGYFYSPGEHDFCELMPPGQIVLVDLDLLRGRHECTLVDGHIAGCLSTGWSKDEVRIFSPLELLAMEAE